MHPNNNLFRQIWTALKNAYSNEPRGNNARRLNILASFIYGIINSRRANLPHIAQELPNQGKEESKVKQLIRFLSNKYVTLEFFFLPFAEKLLESLASEPLVLVIDGSTVGRDCVTLMVSVVYQGRALPLLWTTRKGKKGHFPEAMHIELIEAVHQLIPEGRDVVVLGDGEFDGIQWLATLEKFNWRYVCRTAHNSVFYQEDKRFLSHEICPQQGQKRGIEKVQFTEQKYGFVTAIAWWERGYKKPIYLVSNFETAKDACFWYKKRFRIETFFSDQKSRGFNLQKSHLSDPERLTRLLIASSLAYIWIIYLAEHAINEGWQELIDRRKRTDLSLFQLGLRVLKRLLREGGAIPEFNFSMFSNALIE